MSKIIIIIIIITLCKSQGYLAEHECSTNRRGYKSTKIRINQIECVHHAYFHCVANSCICGGGGGGSWSLGRLMT